MVRVLISIVVLLFFNSCCYKGIRNEMGHARKKIKVPSIEDKNIFSKIDTMAIYELKYIITNMDIQLSHNPEENKGRMFLRFYGNGKLSHFTVGWDHKTFSYNPTHKIVREDFDSKKSEMGYFYIDKNKIKIKQFGAEYCKSFTRNGELEIKNDTLIIHEEYGGFISSDYQKKVYIKNTIGNEYLEKWQADW